MEHNSDFSHDLEVGLAGEKLVADLLSFKKLEVKRDLIALKTGNIFIEYESRGMSSGIAKSKAEWWVFVLGDDTVIFVDELRLKAIARSYLGTDRDVLGGDSNTSKGVLIPLSRLVEVN